MIPELTDYHLKPLQHRAVNLYRVMVACINWPLKPEHCAMAMLTVSARALAQRQPDECAKLLREMADALDGSSKVA